MEWFAEALRKQPMRYHEPSLGLGDATMIVYRFTGPSTTRRRRGICPGCDKKVTKSKTFEHTVNPFNKHPTGLPKNWAEVGSDVQAEADAWVPDFRCQNCAFHDWVRSMPAEELTSWIRIDGYERDSARRRGDRKKEAACTDRIVAYEAQLIEVLRAGSGR